MKNEKRNKLGRRILSFVLTAALVAGLMPGNVMTVKAEESTSTAPSVTAFAMPEQLMSSDNFALHTDYKGVAQKVYFGKNGEKQQSWYIAGGEDHDVDGTKDSIVLLCDPMLPMTTGYFDDKSDLVDSDYKTYDNEWNCTYGTAPSRVYANHYGASDLRLITLPSLESSAFSTSEQDMMLATKVYTDDAMLRDEHNSEYTYYTTDKLYAAYGVYEEAIITVGENSADSLNSGLKVSLTSGPYTNDDATKFYLRTPYLENQHSVHNVSPVNDNVGCASVKLSTPYAVVPAFRLNLASVLFASVAPAATPAASLTDTMTFRVDGEDKIESEASYTTEGVYVDVAEGETVYLYVQGNDGINDWVYSQTISEDDVVEPSSIMASAKDANGTTLNLSTLDLSQCKIWLEKSDDNLAYAVMVERHEIHEDKDGNNFCDVCGSEHIHEWKYFARDNTITAVCNTDDWLVREEKTIVISASDKTYDGTAVIASLDNKIDSKDYNSSIVYTAEDGGSLTDGKPVNVGTYTASFTHEGATASVEFEITKATPSITEKPTASAITYGQILNQSKLSNGEADCNGSFAWADGTVKPAVADSNNTEYDVIFTPADKANYNSVTTRLTLRVDKSAMTPNMPESTMSVLYSKKTVGAVTLPEGWVWNDTDKATTLPLEEEVSATATYNGTDKGNYVTESIEITLIRKDCTHEECEEVLYTGDGEKTPTCTESGIGHTECTKCQEPMQTNVTVEATGHTWDNGVVTKEATAAEKGEKTYTCKVCKATKTEAIAALGAPKKGTTAMSDKATYKVTKSDLKSGTASYVGPIDKSATKVTIPATVKIDGVTFKVTAIEKNAFKNNKKVKTVTIGKNVTSIGDNAFYKCTALTKMTIPSKVKTIGKNAFYGCKKMTSATIGENVSKIGSNAFYGCSKLKTLKIKTTKLTTKKIGSKAFTKTPKSMTVKVSKKKLKAYKSMLIRRGVNKKAKFKKI